MSNRRKKQTSITRYTTVKKHKRKGHKRVKDGKVEYVKPATVSEHKREKPKPQISEKKKEEIKKGDSKKLIKPTSQSYRITLLDSGDHRFEVFEKDDNRERILKRAKFYLNRNPSKEVLIEVYEGEYGEGEYKPVGEANSEGWLTLKKDDLDTPKSEEKPIINTKKYYCKECKGNHYYTSNKGKQHLEFQDLSNIPHSKGYENYNLEDHSEEDLYNRLISINQRLRKSNLSDETRERLLRNKKDFFEAYNKKRLKLDEEKETKIEKKLRKHDLNQKFNTYKKIIDRNMMDEAFFKGFEEYYKDAKGDIGEKAQQQLEELREKAIQQIEEKEEKKVVKGVDPNLQSYEAKDLLKNYDELIDPHLKEKQERGEISTLKDFEDEWNSIIRPNKSRTGEDIHRINTLIRDYPTLYNEFMKKKDDKQGEINILRGNINIDDLTNRKLQESIKAINERLEIGDLNEEAEIDLKRAKKNYLKEHKRREKNKEWKNSLKEQEWEETWRDKNILHKEFPNVQYKIDFNEDQVLYTRKKEPFRYDWKVKKETPEDFIKRMNKKYEKEEEKKESELSEVLICKICGARFKDEEKFNRHQDMRKHYGVIKKKMRW
jgi:hypothetical protein